MRRPFLIVAAFALGAFASAWPSHADERVDVTAMDGVQLIAELAGTHGPGIVMVHDAGADRGAWRDAAAAVVARGYRVLRVDLRGRGESSGTADLGLADRDVEGAYRYLLGRKIRPVFLVADGATARAALAVAGRVPTAGVVLVGARAAESDSSAAVRMLRIDDVTSVTARERLAAWLGEANPAGR